MRRIRFSVGTVVLVVVATLCSVTQARADQPPRVAVVISLSVNADAAQSERLAKALAEALQQKFVIEVMAGADVEKKLGDKGVPDDCIANPECVSSLARRLGVDQLLLLTVVRVGERFQVAVTWGDGSDGRTLSRVTVDIDVEQQDPGSVFAVYASRLLPNAAIRAKAAGSGEPTDASSAAQQGAGVGGQGDGGQSDAVLPPIGLPTQARHMTTGSWMAAGAGATLLIAGSVVGLAARSAYNDLDGQECQVMDCSAADIDSLAFRAGTADVLLGAAVVSGIVAGLLYWRSGGRISVADTDVAAYSTGRDIGVAIGGRF